MESSGFESNEINLPNTSVSINAEAISHGGMADCFRIKLSGRQMLLKRLREEFRNKPVYEASLLKEFEIGFSLEHPGLPRYIAYDHDAEGNYLLIDWIRGATLNDFLRRNPDAFLDKRFARRFLNELLDVVGYLHSNQILHLDLKPANIMLTTVGNQVKLLDLGCSLTDNFIDTAGGTPGFTAPEADRSHESADIYSIGKILQHINETTGAYRSRIYRQLIRKATATEPLMRYQAIDEMLSDIHSARRRRGLLRIAATVAWLSILVGTIIALISKTNRTNPAATPEKSKSDTVVITSPAPQQASQQVTQQVPQQAIAPNDGDDLNRQHEAVVKELLNLLPSTLEQLHPYYATTRFRDQKDYDASMNSVTLHCIDDYKKASQLLAAVPSTLHRKYPLISENEISLMVLKGQNYILEDFRNELEQNNAEANSRFKDRRPSVTLREAITSPGDLQLY